MPSARTASFRDLLPRGGNGGFAKRVSRFVNRALPERAVPGFPLLWVACAAAAGLMIVTGGFGTGDLPLGQRSLFWVLLMGWNAAKWQALFAWLVRSDRDWPRAALIGAVPLNLPLPLEIAVCGRLAGVAMASSPLDIWGRAAAISVVIFAVCSLVAWIVLRKVLPRPAPADGLLARARIDAADLLAIRAEDHYCRLHRRGGQSALIHYRFGDSLAEVAGLDGAQVHRGAWVAAGAVSGAEREGRRWRLLLADGTAIPVSATYAAEARRRGWLRRA